jgi:hypothetical protein
MANQLGINSGQVPEGDQMVFEFLNVLKVFHPKKDVR